MQVTAGLVAGCSLVASFYGYSYIYDGEAGLCRERAVTTAMTVFVWSTEVTFNLVAPIATIVLNIMVGQSIHQSINQASKQAISQLLDQSIHRSIN